AAASLLLSLAWAYLLLLTLCSRQPGRSPPGGRQLKFAIVVPAHNEAGGIAATVADLRALDWPRRQFSVIVVADNCTDDTATQAAAAGARVLQRNDPSRRGKGYALEFAFAQLLGEAWADAVVVIDADTRADAHLLASLASAITGGAQVVQAHYAVLNPDASWRTRLMTIAMAAFHAVRSRGREFLNLSCGIRGNGWCLTRQVMQAVPYRAYGLVEDVEYGGRLALDGYRVAYLEAACVRAAMVSRAEHAASQRRRWELGRRQLRRSMAPALLGAAFRPHGRVCLDLAADLLVPPLTQLVLLTAAATAVALYLHIGSAAWLGATDFVALVLYVGRGWHLSGLGWRCAADFLRAPWFMLWKLAVLLKPHSGLWTRTQREHT
ncbi:MAG TPA: glycosyltransferase family 2 protein, partial [Nevskiaceae bacterium]|nr:glycosyltransferase family 2 protein [Nevskiaceae bacterium]